MHLSQELSLVETKSAPSVKQRNCDMTIAQVNYPKPYESLHRAIHITFQTTKIC